MMTKTQRPAHRLQPIGTGETLILRDGRNDSTGDANSRIISSALGATLMARQALARTVDRLAWEGRTCLATNDLDRAGSFWRQWHISVCEIAWRDAATWRNPAARLTDIAWERP